jgi:hypothetical protein
MRALQQPIKKVWAPLPGSQTLALDSRADHTLLHGTRGPGKTACQLMRFRRRVGLGYGPYWRGMILDTEFKDLADVLAQSRRFFGAFEDGAQFLESHSDYKWKWPTGEELLFRHAKKITDYDTYHGHEYPFLGWNELTKHATGELYDKMMSTNRSSFNPIEHTPKHFDDDGIERYSTYNGLPLPPIPLECFSTTNPSGPGHNWVKRRFITPARNGHVVRRYIKIFNPRTQQEETIVIKQVAIFGSYRENPYLDPKYIATLNEQKDPNIKRAWLYGDWSVISGGALDDLWKEEVHKVPRFKVPRNWIVDRAFDWGSTHPFSVGWFAEANGEEVRLDDGTHWCPARGSLIQIGEWYGTEEIGTNRGLKTSAGDIAKGIRDREIAMMDRGLISSQPIPGPADNQISNVRENDVETIEKKMADIGIRWNPSDKSQGSRVNGLQIMRDMLENANRREGAGLYFTTDCPASLEILPSLPRDPIMLDDVDTNAEDHPYDMVRYRCLAGSNRYTTEINIQFAR